MGRMNQEYLPIKESLGKQDDNRWDLSMSMNYANSMAAN
jgi:hypothetical protein